MQKPKSQYQREYGIPIYIKRESTGQKSAGLFAQNTQHKRLEEIVMYI